ncbi:hypothetical protein B0T26DRAFT_331851 [Lasiosphaeria miniovina]|uniref:Uncharacterized protein n=1 Tax=Lasiosphaeria miniovina TaxID=1954250 RepID=A0AA40DWS0_9PEZI|nr:uncharacterized protein B0T26DRAFT_331851 [Lasiosphaeria miniovina]KAK0718460.1 hypothetical protein B0T26DRAFT_331851 [Lasiosphaeria miniovina]
MDSYSPAPAQAGEIDAPDQSLRAKINQMTQEAVSPDPKSTFVNDIWPKLQDEYDTMKERLEEFCKDALKRNAIYCQVKSRTKEVASIKKSLDRREEALWKQSNSGSRASPTYSAKFMTSSDSGSYWNSLTTWRESSVSSRKVFRRKRS